MASPLTSSAHAAPAASGGRRWLLPVALLALAVAGWLGWRAFSPSQQVPAATFTLLDGQKLSTQDLKGKVYLVNFWATSCATCVKEMPNMVQAYNKYKGEGLEYVAVAMSYDAPMYVMNFSQTRQLPFKVAMDADGSAAKAFGDVQLTPTTFLVDRDGRILKRYVGEPEWSSFDALLKQTLAKQA
ncbi:TlpA disulfide reductase family protein [Ralstonia mannitolilytica]|uniref:Thiol-disulfide oxidoreductase resA n=1 Tax=Ralstonia mannitolilytica TaxID=105219 RepID=A0AAJ5D3I0_9RALS|nr:TlpA disulfide reductase family protein [Ralstonia mannitolilytica]CAG2152050.1 Thiol-disulfide oxidoreductase ResA [Ralstonia mannitolilytica]CAJ0726657.1 Thiol-disulfide oxidoreductase ResA [Ralstonia mannitolilytica]SUD86606.1 Thiol-disulfide oxidoreductase resA [Ralstonia mannitolilytica]SUD92549.1 Thiol-disulfide oxidoreductase resA [Ralstonia mannitolilytica]SUD96267.1 Thiol-disulfide oxidoreductase resA [Ralstonia mannitolilytica]